MPRYRQLDVTQIVPVPPSVLTGRIRLGAVTPGAQAPGMFKRPMGQTPRDWAVYLLHTAAEVEHALMVQYLYAAYSLRPGLSIPNDPNGNTTDVWTDTLTQIAKEEMGHLQTVQNLLRLIGGPLCFERENFPLKSELYPFPFALEPVSKDSLAKYVFAEMTPDSIPPEILTPAQRSEITQRAKKAAEAGGVHFANHVGTLYTTLAYVFAAELQAADFRNDRDDYQSLNWSSTNDNVDDLLDTKLLPARTQDEALRALDVIARQGEAFDPQNPDGSHFQRFLPLYLSCPEDSSALVWPVRRNPSTSESPNTSLITNQTTMLWARLFNLRYRVLLTSLLHASTLTASVTGPTQTNLRKMLLGWVYKEMIHGAGSIRTLAIKLAEMQAGDDPTQKAGAPFELPYTLSLPDLGPERWRLHLDLIDASRQLIDELLLAGNDNLLVGIKKRDGETAADGRRKQIADNQNSPV